MLQSILIVTDNYSKDLAAAKDADLFSKGAMPKKADLYAAIEAANSELNAVAESCGLAVDEAIELQDSEYLESIDDTPLPDRAIGREIDLDDVPVSQSVRDGLNDLFKRSADMARSSYVITPKGSHTIDQNGLTAFPAAPIEPMTNAAVITGDPMIDNSIAYANAQSNIRAAELHAEWTAQQQQREDSKKPVAAKAEKPAFAPWNDDSNSKAQQFFGTKARVLRSKIISELVPLHGSKVVSEQLNLSEQKIKKEARAYDIYNSDPIVRQAIDAGMSLSHVIDNISKPDTYQQVSRDYIQKDRDKKVTTIVV